MSRSLPRIFNYSPPIQSSIQRPLSTSSRRFACSSKPGAYGTSGSRQRLQTSAFGWTSIAVFIAVGASTGLVVGLVRGYQSTNNSGADEHIPIQNMVVKGMPPGRPGTLTPEEEAKLRELWHLALQVFGVAEQTTASTPSTPNGRMSSLSRTTSEVSVGEKKKKSRLSFLKKKKEPEPASEPESARSSPASSQGAAFDLADNMQNDKHGLAKAFKAALAGHSPEELRDAFWDMVKHDHPDALLLRFLRARKWVVGDAAVMAMAALHWRIAESKVDSDVILNGEEGMLKWSESSDKEKAKEGADFMQQIRMGKSFLHGVDKDGRPICYVRVRLHKPGEQSESSLERFTVFTIETARMLLRPPVDTATIVFDMTGFGMSNMDYTPVKFMIKCFEANYPESLGTVLVHKAPWVFKGIWSVIKGWLDPVVAGKIHFTNSLDELAGYIDRENIIKELDGPNPWTYQYPEPSQGENSAMQDTQTKQRLLNQRAELSKEYESSVLEWIASSPLSSTPSRPNTSHGTNASNNVPTVTPAPTADALRTKRDDIAAQLRKNYWTLDPYVRARSLYDRTGELAPEGGGVLASKTNHHQQGGLKVPEEAAGRRSVESVAQSFYTTKENWDDGVD